MEGNAERRGKDEELYERLAALAGFPQDEMRILEGYLAVHGLIELFEDYPILGLSTDTERKLETIRELAAYDGRDVSWKQADPTGTG